MNKLELEIDGMSCSHCVAAVTNALGEIPGVDVEHVGIGSAQVNYAPETVSPQQIVPAIEDAGYSAQTKG